MDEQTLKIIQNEIGAELSGWLVEYDDSHDLADIRAKSGSVLKDDDLDAFDKTLLAVPSNAWGEVYAYALSIGVAKRDDGLIASSNREWSLRLSYKANMPALAENAATYSMMLENENGPYGPLKWTPEHFRECIEIAHLSIFALDQEGYGNYKFYREQKDVIDEMCNRLGYNFTVTSAKRNDNTGRNYDHYHGNYDDHH